MNIPRPSITRRLKINTRRRQTRPMHMPCPPRLLQQNRRPRSRGERRFHTRHILLHLRRRRPVIERLDPPPERFLFDGGGGAEPVSCRTAGGCRDACRGPAVLVPRHSLDRRTQWLQTGRMESHRILRARLQQKLPMNAQNWGRRFRQVPLLARYDRSWTLFPQFLRWAGVITGSRSLGRLCRGGRWTCGERDGEANNTSSQNAGLCSHATDSVSRALNCFGGQRLENQDHAHRVHEWHDLVSTIFTNGAMEQP